MHFLCILPKLNDDILLFFVVNLPHVTPVLFNKTR